MGSSLDHISIVLVDTKTPANIGATARCMMNMGLSRLILVNPPKDERGEAAKLAAGADAVLSGASLYSTLAEAVSDHGLVIGTSRHSGKRRKNVLTPREAATVAIPLLPRNRVAFVFGNEVNGLDHRELSHCHEVIAIPSDDAFPSLNLSHAVMVVAYELFTAAGGFPPDAEHELAPSAESERFYRHLQKTLESIGFLDRDHPERMMSSLRQVFGRARLERREVNILRGILRNIDRALPSGGDEEVLNKEL